VAKRKILAEGNPKKTRGSRTTKYPGPHNERKKGPLVNLIRKEFELEKKRTRPQRKRKEKSKGRRKEEASDLGRGCRRKTTCS